MEQGTGYQMMVYERNKKQQYQIRMAIVTFAQQRGIRAASRHFHCSRNTVRLWLRRLKKEGRKGLCNRSKAPKHIPHQTPKELEEKIIQARQQAPCYGPKRLKYFFGFKVSEGAIGRILRQKQLTRKQKKKYLKKRDLRAVKARYKALSHHQEDVKFLYDIAHYYPQMKEKKLPKYQYTLRDTKTGMMCLGYASSYSETHSILFTKKYLKHLDEHQVSLNEVIIQTDNGAEFGGSRRRFDKKHGLTHEIQSLGSSHVFIPPGMSNANADVESVHATIEHEFYDLESFGSKREFLEKAQIYQNFYNWVRPNFSKGSKTPIQKIEEEYPGCKGSLLNFPVVDLDKEFEARYESENAYTQMGQDLPVSPETTLVYR